MGDSLMSKEIANMYKEGDWVHTQDGIGIVTRVFPHYYQYWEKSIDDRYRYETYGDDEKLATSLLGEKKEVGDWIKDIIYVKRLCDHDLNPKKRIMCFYTKAYANDRIAAKEKKTVEKLLKDQKLAEKFKNYQCQYPEPLRGWNILISADQAVLIKKALDSLENNNDEKLNMTMRQIETYFKTGFDVDIYEDQHKKLFANATIQTQLHPEGAPGYYNKDREEIVRSIQIVKNHYDSEYLERLCQAQGLDPDIYDSRVWARAGWDGTEL